MLPTHCPNLGFAAQGLVSRWYNCSDFWRALRLFVTLENNLMPCGCYTSLYRAKGPRLHCLRGWELLVLTVCRFKLPAFKPNRGLNRQLRDPFLKLGLPTRKIA